MTQEEQDFEALRQTLARLQWQMRSTTGKAVAEALLRAVTPSEECAEAESYPPAVCQCEKKHYSKKDLQCVRCGLRVSL